MVTLDRGPDGSRLHPAVRDGVAYIRLPRIGPRRYPFARGLVAALPRADVVHVHGIDGLADQVAMARPRALTGLSTHGGYFHTERGRWLKRRLWKAVTRRTLRCFDAVWFSSGADAERFGADVVGAVVPNGIDAARFASDRRRPSRDRWVVLGRVVPHKGLDDLFAAIRHQRDPVPELDVIGPVAPAERARVERAARGLPTRVRLWGTRPAEFVRERLATASWSVFPSRYEGFGLAALEAMGAGVPALVADVPALRDAVSRGGGRRIDFRHPRRAASALDAVRDLGIGDGLGDEARRVASDADWSVRVEGFLAAYGAT